MEAGSPGEDRSPAPLGGEGQAVHPRVELPRQHALPLGRITLHGYSRSTVATFFFIPEISTMFDAGACSAQSAAAADVFVSHLHVDHAQGLPWYASHRNMLRMTPGRVHVPRGTGDQVRAWLDQVAGLQGPEGGHFDYTLDELRPGDEVPVRGRHLVRCFATDHRVPSLGFTVVTRREKLLSELAHLPGEEIGRRKREGEPVTEVVETPIFTYLGDTGPEALDRHPEVGESETLLMECTFLAPEHLENARETRHLHLNDIACRAEIFRGRRVVLSHFSMRYRPEEIRERVWGGLPASLREKVELWV